MGVLGVSWGAVEVLGGAMGALWEGRVCQGVQWGASECGLVEGLELDLVPFQVTCPPHSLRQSQQGRSTTGGPEAASLSAWDTHWGQGKAGQEGQQGLARVQGLSPEISRQQGLGGGKEPHTPPRNKTEGTASAGTQEPSHF